MNVYIEYETYRQKYYNAQMTYEELVQEKEELFLRTQPGSVDFGKERVSGGKKESSFERYLTEKERKNLDARIEEARAILEDRLNLLNVKRDELEKSPGLYDKIYYLAFIKNLKVGKVAMELGYSEPHIYRILQNIKQRCGMKREERFESNRIVRRECDESMARKKGLLPCEKKCKTCMAAIEVHADGERNHYYPKTEYSWQNKEKA